MTVINVFYLCLYIFEKMLYLCDFVFGHLRDDLKFTVRVAGDNAGCSGGRHSFEVSGIWYDYTFDILNNTSADLQKHTVGKCAQNLARLCSGISQCDRLCTAHCGDKFLL